MIDRLLEDDQQIPLAGYKTGQERKYIDVREFTLLVAKRMVGRDPALMKNGKITGDCPVTRFVGLDIIKDSDRRKEIQPTADQWIAECVDAPGDNHPQSYSPDVAKYRSATTDFSSFCLLVRIDRKEVCLDLNEFRWRGQCQAR